jgi:hypothetical protein
LTVTVRDQDANARLETGRHANAIDLLAPDNPVALIRKPRLLDLLVLTPTFLADEFHHSDPEK